MKALFLVVSLFGLVQAQHACASCPIEELSSSAVQICALVYDLSQETELLRYNDELCRTRFSPCSTFKIPNALLALELDVLDKGQCLRWDGSPHPYSTWEKDHTLATAVRYSVVWFFQEIAQCVGRERYEQYLALLGYGNRECSGGVDTFWLDESLKISPEEQLHFLNRLYRNALPLSESVVEAVKPMLVRASGEGWTWSGKTGMKRGIGWFVGHLDRGGHEYTFVVCILGETASSLAAERCAKELCSKFITDGGYDSISWFK